MAKLLAVICAIALGCVLALAFASAAQAQSGATNYGGYAIADGTAAWDPASPLPYDWNTANYYGGGAYLPLIVHLFRTDGVGYTSRAALGRSVTVCTIPGGGLSCGGYNYNLALLAAYSQDSGYTHTYHGSTFY